MNKYTLIKKVIDFLMIGVLRSNSNIKETVEYIDLMERIYGYRYKLDVIDFVTNMSDLKSSDYIFFRNYISRDIDVIEDIDSEQAAVSIQEKLIEEMNTIVKILKEVN